MYCLIEAFNKSQLKIQLHNLVGVNKHIATCILKYDGKW